MPPLSGRDVLKIWESGMAEDPVGRALVILAQATAGSTTRDALAALPVGRRDAGLLAVREETFGSRLDGAASCPRCRERVEFSLEAPALRARFDRGDGPGEGEARLGPWALRYRLPTSADLRAVAGAGSVEAAARALTLRCVVEARRDGALVPVEEVPAKTLSTMAGAMAEQDPLAEVLLDYTCPACGQPGQILLDIASYLWEEIKAEAVRLLREVDALARAYGWRESDILALSAPRRRAYLELTGR
jgi:hypothetical protein